MLEGAVRLKSGTILSYRTVPSPDAIGFCHVEVFYPVGGGGFSWLGMCAPGGRTAKEALEHIEHYCQARILTRHEQGKAPAFEVIPT